MICLIVPEFINHYVLSRNALSTHYGILSHSNNEIMLRLFNSLTDALSSAPQTGADKAFMKLGKESNVPVSFIDTLMGSRWRLGWRTTCV